MMVSHLALKCVFIEFNLIDRSLTELHVAIHNHLAACGYEDSANSVVQNAKSLSMKSFNLDTLQKDTLFRVWLELCALSQKKVSRNNPK